MVCIGMGAPLEEGGIADGGHQSRGLDYSRRGVEDTEFVI